MNREIKFRMWNNVRHDNSKSKYFYETDPVMECLKQQINISANRHPNYDHIADGCAFEQYTGLKDKNGKDIYDGDILNHPNSGNFEIRFEDYGFYLFYNGFKQNSHTTEYMEVIGNIHENPELLK